MTVSAKPTKKVFNCPAKIAAAAQSFKKKRFLDVETILAEVKQQCAGSQNLDSVYYLLGSTYLITKKPDEARLEYQLLIRDFSSSPFADESRFRIGHTMMLAAPSFERAQDLTHDAIREFQSFLESYPQSPFADSAKIYLLECQEKIAYKEFMNARFYERINKYEAAIIYFKSFIETFPDSKYLPQARLHMAINFSKVNRASEAIVLLDELIVMGNKEIKAKALLEKAKLSKKR